MVAMGEKVAYASGTITMDAPVKLARTNCSANRNATKLFHTKFTEELRPEKKQMPRGQPGPDIHCTDEVMTIIKS